MILRRIRNIEEYERPAGSTQYPLVEPPGISKEYARKQQRDLWSLATDELKGGSLSKMQELGLQAFGWARTNLQVNLMLLLEAVRYDTHAKTVLDLGCGSPHSVDASKYPGVHEPWMARFLHATKDKTGMQVIGVDYHEQDVAFEYHATDLTTPGSLNALYGRKVHAATAFKLFNSPQLEYLVTGSTSDNAGEPAARKLKDTLFPQLENLLGETGTLVWYGDPSTEYVNSNTHQRDLFLN